MKQLSLRVLWVAFVIVAPACTTEHERSGRNTAGTAPTIRPMDHAFAIETPLTAGQHTIRVENAGVEPHDLVLLKLVPGKTVEDVIKSLNPERARRADQKDQPAEPLPNIGSGAGGIAAMRSGMVAFFTTTFTPGEYVLLCMATAPDGRSHIEHGMIQQIRVH